MIIHITHVHKTIYYRLSILRHKVSSLIWIAFHYDCNFIQEKSFPQIRQGLADKMQLFSSTQLIMLSNEFVFCEIIVFVFCEISLIFPVTAVIQSPTCAAVEGFSGDNGRHFGHHNCKNTAYCPPTACKRVPCVWIRGISFYVHIGMHLPLRLRAGELSFIFSIWWRGVLLCTHAWQFWCIFTGERQ